MCLSHRITHIDVRICAPLLRIRSKEPRRHIPLRPPGSRLGTVSDRVTPPPAEGLEPIVAMARAIASSTSVHDVFRALFLYTTHISQADGIFVAAYDRERDVRRCVYAASLAGAPGGERVLEENADLGVFPDLPLNDGPQSRAIATGEPVTTPDLDAAVVGLPRVDTGSDIDERPPRSSVAVPFAFEGEVLGAFEVQSTYLDAFAETHLPGMKMAATLAAIAVRNLDLLERERAQHEATLRALGVALEYRDLETKGHTDRVVALALAFGREVGLGDEALRALRWGTYLHDLGKVAISDQILLKPGKLTEAEFATIREHTLIGVAMCEHIPFLPDGARKVVRNHHERWDGRGYPDGLAGEDIPLLARLFTLVDVYDALTSTRPYKQAWTHDDAVAELELNAGRQFDPDLLTVFVDLLERRGREQVRH